MRKNTPQSPITSQPAHLKRNRTNKYLAQTAFDLVNEIEKYCSGCKQTLPVSLFYKKPDTKWGYHVYCFSCSRKENNKRYYANRTYYAVKSRCRRYNITEEEYTRLLIVQQNQCAICKLEFDSTQSGQGAKSRPCVDHNHDTGEVRGLLCALCNQGIGLLKEDLNIIASAMTYISKHRSK